MKSNNIIEGIIDGLGYEELLILRSSLMSRHFHTVLDKRIRAFENPNLVCPVCGSEVSEEGSLVLIFGPRTLRKKARFCGLDCMEYFIRESRLRNEEVIRRESLKKK